MILIFYFIDEAIQRVAQNLPSHVFNSLSQVASNQTPHYPHTPGAYGAQSTSINTVSYFINIVDKKMEIFLLFNLLLSPTHQVDKLHL